MEQITLHRLSADPSSIDEAAAQLLRGGIVAFPTETVYGLGVNASKQAAVEALFQLKQRPSDHPLIIHVSGLADASCWARLNAQALRLIGALWPGPLSLILPRRAGIPMYALAAQKTVALRCPSHPVARALLSRFSALGGKGVAAPSANPYGKISPTDSSHVEADLQQMMQAFASKRLRLSDPQLPYCCLIDGGESEAGIESTILDLSTDQPRVLRPGAVSREQIESVLGMPVPLEKPQVDPAPQAKRLRGSAPKASGTQLSHYAPNKPLYLVDPATQPEMLEQLQAQGVKQLAVWGIEEDAFPASNFEQLASFGRLPDSAQALAHVLYRTLRAMDQSDAQALLIALAAPAEVLSQDQAWEAVLDRLERATFATKAGLLKPQTGTKADPAAALQDTSADALQDTSADAMDFDMSFDDLGTPS